MAQKDSVIVNIKQKHQKLAYWILFGILGFIVIYFPFFGGNLRYQMSGTLSATTNYFGTIFYKIGMFVLVWGILSLFCTGGKRGISVMIIGCLILVISMYFLNPGTIGSLSGGKSLPKGYH